MCDLCEVRELSEPGRYDARLRLERRGRRVASPSGWPGRVLRGLAPAYTVKAFIVARLLHMKGGQGYQPSLAHRWRRCTRVMDAHLWSRAQSVIDTAGASAQTFIVRSFGVWNLVSRCAVRWATRTLSGHVVQMQTSNGLDDCEAPTDAGSPPSARAASRRGARDSCVQPLDGRCLSRPQVSRRRRWPSARALAVCGARGRRST